MKHNITFRTQLIESVQDFCNKAGVAFLTKSINLVELIVLLARYKEEGISLCPKVYITSSINNIISMLPDSEHIKIGSSSYDIDGIKTVLKKSAPLATHGWLIYIQDSGSHLEYGLFRDSGNPISVLIDDILMTSQNSTPIVKAFQIADECVEVRANHGEYHYVFLNHRKEDSPAPLIYLESLVKYITKNVDISVSEPTRSFLHKLFFDSFRQSHGCLISVINSNEIPPFLAKDSIILENPINFPELVKKLKQKEIESYVLDSKGVLLKGMLNSDGVIVFDNNGRLLGYNCFIEFENNGKVFGGARKRAYYFIREKIGNDISAIFMQSRDGWTEFHGEEL
ncbi:hypothetical protein [Aeromonas dhakensis]|uniref:hypothetical protein n=1 Tax=Aeromonas dhakensis TaxID=196024 RepID=UPI003D1A8087